MACSFSDISKSIIDDSIESVLYIDNEIALPFRDSDENANYDFCSKLYSSFKENYSRLDFYEFSDYQTWEPEKEKFFKGVDLLILDWKLETSGIEFESTLKILDEAIRTKSLHFINIYTSESEKDFQDIPFYINAYYSGIKPEEKQVIYNSLEGYLEDQGLNPDNVFEELKEQTLALNKELDTKKKGKLFGEIQKWFNENYQSEKGGFEDLLKNHFDERGLLKCYCKLAYILNYVVLREGEVKDFTSRTEREDYLFLNHTIIQISQKSVREPQDLCESFRDAIVGSTNNYLTIMGLEMRNRFKLNSAFIGKDIDQISDLAFFFHKEHNNNSEDSFYDFLKNIWRDQASSFLYSEGMELKIFKALSDYKDQNDINKQIEEKKGEKSFDNDLALLNHYYNRLNVERKLSDKIKFGDIFSFTENPAEFLLCITAHCDCLYPEKINHTLYFVKGSRANINGELVKGDAAFSSYLKNGKDEPFVVKWTNKPVSLFIPPEKNIVGNEKIPINIYGEEKSIHYVATIKDNYAQRIANNAFSYPLRVGIYFADRKDLDPSDD